MRIRTIKPEFWTHEGLASKPEFTRLLAIAILNWADDEGYFMANPILLRGQIFPFLDDSKIIPRSLQDLSSVGWIELGEDDQGRSIGRVLNFAKHQRVDKPKRSVIKPLWGFQDASKTHPRCVQDASKEEGKGREGNGTGKGREPIAETQPIGWSSAGGWTGITDDDFRDWAEAYPACDIPRQLASMAQWLKSNPQKAKKRLWRKFLTSWLERDQERGGGLKTATSAERPRQGIEDLMGGRKLEITKAPAEKHEILENYEHPPF